MLIAARSWTQYSDAMDVFDTVNAPIQMLTDEVTEQYSVSLAMKREDLLHAEIMGNKFRKLKYNIKAALQSGGEPLLSFGGAYSNHILALSAAGRLFGLPTIGVIRGDELQHSALNPILERACKNGMRLSFVSRADYRRKSDVDFLQQLQAEFGPFTVIPEGGTNLAAIKGAAEIMQDISNEYDVITCACGTGGTLAGMIKGAYQHELSDVLLLGFPVLKGGEFIRDEILKWVPEEITSQVRWDINTEYHFGGYAKTSAELVRFIQWFQERHGIALDYIYTGKMMYGLYALIESGVIAAGSKVLAIHTGGTQTASLRHLNSG